MKTFWGRALAAAALGVPAALYITGQVRWGNGFLLGEGLGLVSYVWISLTVVRAFSKDFYRSGRVLLINGWLRLAVMAVVFFFACRWPAVQIWAVAAGYSLIQMPAAVLRAYSENARTGKR